MKKGMWVVLLELKRMLCSPALWLTVVAEAAWMFLSTMIVTFNGGIDSVIYGTFFALDLNSGYMVLLCLLPIFPYALAYVREWNERATPFWMIRTGVRPYMVAKLIATAASAFLAVFLGILLYACIQRLFLPWGDAAQNVGIQYDGDSVAACLLLTASHKGVSAMLVAVCALWVSLYVSNVYAALIGPNVLYWVALRLDGLFALPSTLRPVYWIQAYGGGYHWAESYWMHWLVVLVLCILMGMNAVGRMRKKVEHD